MSKKKSEEISTISALIIFCELLTPLVVMFGIIGCLIFGFASYSNMNQMKKNLIHYEQIEGYITGFSTDVASTGSTGGGWINQAQLKCKYTIEDKVYEEYATNNASFWKRDSAREYLDKHFQIGDEIKIYYRPSDHKQFYADINLDNKEKWLRDCLILFIILLPVLLCSLAHLKKRNSKLSDQKNKV